MAAGTHAGPHGLGDANEHRLTVAIINAGMPRNVGHPLVAASFALMCSSLHKAGHRVLTYLFLSNSNGVGGERSGMAATTVGSRLWEQTLRIYEPTRVLVSDDALPCKYKDCIAYPCSRAHDSTYNWLAQFYKLRLAYRMALEDAASKGLVIDWFVRVRTDMLHLQPLPPLSTLSAIAAYVPSGVMTRVPMYQMLNDHIFVCAAGSLCEAYFQVTERAYGDCARMQAKGERVRAPWPPQEFFARRFKNNSLRLFQHAYTLTRNFGPHCERLECDADNAFATGCVARHLPAHVAGCKRLRAVWHNVTWERPDAWGPGNKHHLMALFRAILTNSFEDSTKPLSDNQRKLVEYAAFKSSRPSRLRAQY